MLDQILLYHKPTTWDDGSYGAQRYRKVQVFGHEYSRVIENFTPELRTRVQLIYRIQNPYIYGRYKLKVEQLQLTSAVYEVGTISTNEMTLHSENPSPSVTYMHVCCKQLHNSVNHSICPIIFHYSSMTIH
jgi:hypothetical protein